MACDLIGATAPDLAEKAADSRMLLRLSRSVCDAQYPRAFSTTPHSRFAAASLTSSSHRRASAALRGSRLPIGQRHGPVPHRRDAGRVARGPRTGPDTH
eukprot:2657586-Prymnesium_polylepis.1